MFGARCDSKHLKLSTWEAEARISLVSSKSAKVAFVFRGKISYDLCWLGTCYRAKNNLKLQLSCLHFPTTEITYLCYVRFIQCQRSNVGLYVRELEIHTSRIMMIWELGR